MNNNLLLVVMGGISSEKEVSMRSGEAMYKALLEKGYNAERFELTASNAVEIIKKRPSCVVLALHGKGGEDGCIQGMLELAGIPYTGSGVASSAICMNKILTKKIIAYEGIRTAKFISVGINDVLNIAELKTKIKNELGFPVVVKASCQGSSVGVKIAKTEDEIANIILEVYQLDHELLLEEYISGKEVTIPVAKTNGIINLFPIIEIASQNAFYDYESKYTSGMSRHIIPARIKKETEELIKDMAVVAYKALNCSGLVRIDFMLNQKEIPYLMEVNTLPGMTSTSLVPDAARAIGVNLSDLISSLVESALSTKD